MGIYRVTLNIAHGAKDTRRSITMNLPAQDRLAAAINAERIADRLYLREPATEYSHAVSVKPVPLRRGQAFTQTVLDAV